MALEIRPIFGKWKQNFRKSQKKVVSSRLHIGHTRITHFYLRKEEQQSMCHACQTAYTIKHVLIECIDLASTRETFYNANCMKELFLKKTKVDTIMSFLKAVEKFKDLTNKNINNTKVYKIKSLS